MMVEYLNDPAKLPTCIVGESPVWDAELGCFFLVDIVGKAIHQCHLNGELCRSWKSEDFPTSVSVIDEEFLLVGLASGIATLETTTGEFGTTITVDVTVGNRLNEGKCDRRGRLWLGSMQTNLRRDGAEKPMTRHSGALYRVNSRTNITQHSGHEFGIANTLAWSPDETTFYFGDSLRDVIFAYDYDRDDGVPSNPRPFLDQYGRGAPDGSAIDVDGCLWNVRFGGGQLIRITPNGRVDRAIDLPVTNPTSCTFAGPNLDRLIVTSATFALSDHQRKENPLEGAILVLDVGYSGLPDARFRGTLSSST